MEFCYIFHNLLCAVVQFCVTVQFVVLCDAVCCMLLYSLMYFVVKFCVTVQFVVLSDAVVCVLWCGLLCAVLQLNIVCTFQDRGYKFVINSNKVYFI
jgi:hypothetical protein